MNATDFVEPSAGRTVRTALGYTAFVPAPLPPELHYDADLVMALSRADAALSELSGLGRTLPNPHLLISPYIRREALLSSRIEGTRASLSELFLNELDAGRQDDIADVLEVRNYALALEYGMARLTDLPLSLRLVREIHARLMEGVRGEHATPGEFRRSQNWIGPPGSTLITAPYVPPPVPEMTEALGAWESFLHERDSMPVVIQCALMHEQFEAIHPFLDGNGRIGRLLITLFLMERGRLSQPLLYLSDYIEGRKDDYYALLQRVRTHGDWRSWLFYFLRGVEETAEAGTRQAGQLADMREQMRTQLREKHRALALLDELFVNPYLTVARAASVLRVSTPTARQAIRVLEESEIVQEITGRSWGRLYLAVPIFRALEVDRVNSNDANELKQSSPVRM